MKRWMALCLWTSIALTVAGAGCGPAGSVDSEPDERSTSSHEEETTDDRAQSLEHDVDHWMVAGTESRGEPVSDEDGQPTTISGRFLNGGAGIDAGALGGKEWLIASESGFVQLLKADGTRKGENRPTFGGNGKLRFVERGKDNWLAGGTTGEVQRIDRFGQPTGDRGEPFGGDAVTAGAWGSSHWVVGSNNGQLVHLEPNSFNTRSSVLDVGSSQTPIVDVLFVRTKWWAFTGSAVAEVTSNQVLEPTTIAEGRTVTAAAFRDGTLVVGSDDGRVLAADTGSGLGSANWQQALDGQPVRAFAYNGSEWLVVGDGGRVRRLGGDGSPTGSVNTVVGGHDIETVRPTSSGWMIGVEGPSSVTTLDQNLESGVEQTDLLGGATVRAIAPSPAGMLVVGGDGKYRLFDAGGEPKTEAKTVDGTDRLNAARWNGDTFLVGGAGGTVATIDPSGSVSKTIDVLDGADVSAVSWNRQVWLIVGANGKVRRLQSDGTKFREPKQLGLDAVRAAKYNGDGWMLVGAKGKKGAFAIVSGDLNVSAGPTRISGVDGALRALDWNGNEWLVGGDGGTVYRVDQAGSLIKNQGKAGQRAIFNGRTIRAISFNGNRYLVGGEDGITRRLEFDTLPIRTGVLVNNYRTVHTIAWAHARGFAGGPCISADYCVTGTCRGTVTDGFCCESACDGPCESCFEADTGEPDGQCVPVPKGEKPPERKQTAGNGCVKASPESCGQTGTCDGQGECALYGSDTQCSPPSCSDGQQTPAGQCDGKQNCVVPDKSECEPYICGENACRSSCESDDHCFTGFECKDGECQPLGSDNDDDGDGNGDNNGGNGDGSGNGGDENGGGCAAAGGSSPVGSLAWIVAVLGGLLLMRRRRN